MLLLPVSTVKCSTSLRAISGTNLTWSTMKLRAPSARCGESVVKSLPSQLQVCTQLANIVFIENSPNTSRFLVLQLFLSSPKSSLKFAAIRTLAKLAQSQPQAVSACNLDMEKLINDENRSVATYAITTLLKVRLAQSLLCGMHC